MPFKSEKQRKWMHANKPKMAKKWEKEEKSVEEDRDYKAEYKKFQSSTKAKKYRAELNKYNRQKGTYGNGDGKDASHKGGKIAGFEAESTNRGRAEKSRLKKEDITMLEAKFTDDTLASRIKHWSKQHKGTGIGYGHVLGHLAVHMKEMGWNKSYKEVARIAVELGKKKTVESVFAVKGKEGKDSYRHPEKPDFKYDPEKVNEAFPKLKFGGQKDNPTRDKLRGELAKQHKAVVKLFDKSQGKVPKEDLLTMVVNQKRMLGYLEDSLKKLKESVNEGLLNEFKLDMENFTDKLLDALQGATVDLSFGIKHDNKIEKMMTDIMDVDTYYQVKDKKEMIKGLKKVKSNVAKIKSLNKSVFDKLLSDIDKAYKTFEGNIQKRIQISESVNEAKKPRYTKDGRRIISKSVWIRTPDYSKLIKKGVKHIATNVKGKTKFLPVKIESTNEGKKSKILEFDKYRLGGLLDSKLKKRLERTIKIIGGKVDAVGDDYVKFRISSMDLAKLPSVIKKLDRNKNVWIGDKRNRIKR